MTCFCPLSSVNLSNLTPRANLSVGAVPPQLGNLASLLGLTNMSMSGAPRLDMAIDSLLPNMSSQAFFSAHMSGFPSHIAALIPSAGPMLMRITARIGAVAASFPMLSASALMAAIKSSLNSMVMHLLPVQQMMPTIPKPQMTNMVLAARLTLGLRKQGLCPMALANVDMSFAQSMSLGEPRSTISNAVSMSSSFSASMPKFALPMPKLGLAMSLAALAPLASLPPSLGLPPASHPNFAAMAMTLISRLMTLPSLPFSPGAMFADLARLSDFLVIQEAFGMDAMTPAGVGRVQAMLNFVARLRLPTLPNPLLALPGLLDMLPSLDLVQTGATVASASGASFSSAMSFTPGLPAFLPIAEALNALRDMLSSAFGALPAAACNTCKIAA